MGCGSSKETATAVINEQSKETATVVIPEQEKEEPPQDIDKFRKEALVAHNKRRKLHRAPPLKLSGRLNRMAQKWAEYLAANKVLGGSPQSHKKSAGELTAYSNYVMSGEDFVKKSYDQIKDYDFSDPGYQEETSSSDQVLRLILEVLFHWVNNSSW